MLWGREVTHHKGQGGPGGEEVLAGHAARGTTPRLGLSWSSLLLVIGSLGSVACGPDSQLLETWTDRLKVIQV